MLCDGHRREAIHPLISYLFILLELLRAVTVFTRVFGISGASRRAEARGAHAYCCSVEFAGIAFHRRVDVFLAVGAPVVVVLVQTVERVG